ncbi:MAG: CPBP family intramembrane glutamic endopeptidase [Caldilineaceae bacterium]
MSTTTYPIAQKASSPARPNMMHKILVALLWLLGGVLVLLLALPVLLSFVATAIPRYLSVGLAILDLALIVALFRLKRTWPVIIGFWFSVIAIALLAVWLSQVYAATPPILDANKQPLPNSIAVLEKVNLGGSEQWITIRGKDVTKPVLLYLGIGGPGAGGFPASALSLKPLEDHFVVVNWDQPGTGKSYNAAPISTLTVDRFVADAHELTQELVFRALFQNRLSAFVSPGAAIVLAALAFALAHYSPGPALVIFVDLLSVFVDGVIYGIIYQRSRNIFVSWIPHFLGDVVALFLLLALK